MLTSSPSFHPVGMVSIIDAVNISKGGDYPTVSPVIIVLEQQLLAFC
jgi:hypothetical protein